MALTFPIWLRASRFLTILFVSLRVRSGLDEQKLQDSREGVEHSNAT